jgi:hypothetical protein
MTPEQDQHLEKVGALHGIFKSDAQRSTCIAIAKRAAAAGQSGYFWPDEVETELPKDDCNCIGPAYRIMKNKLGVIALVDPIQTRRSQTKKSRGHLIPMYRTVDVDLARSIARLAPPGQLNLIQP